MFSGCGGFSEGLKQAGVIDCKWAVERDKAATKAFEKNNPKATVFQEKCEEFLIKVKRGVKENFFSGQQIPAKGEVELLIGGPPCQVTELNLKDLELSLQGFSEINMHKGGKNAQEKINCVPTYLDFCDFYRPKFFILENVRMFATDNKSAVLKYCIKRLLDMGYQCTFGILQVTLKVQSACKSTMRLQAGQFGVPQTRRRFFLLAARQDQKLPQMPVPKHVFSPEVGSIHSQYVWLQTGKVLDNLKELYLAGSGSSALF